MVKVFLSFLALCSMAFAPIAYAQNTTAPAATDTIRIVRIDANGVGTPSAVPVNRVFNTAGIGYSSGGAVTQLTSRTTGVTLNSLTGAITLFTAAGSATPASFTVTNSSVAATDVIAISVKSSTTNLYEVFVTAVGAGSFQVTFFTTGGTTSDAPVINFAVIKGAAS